MVVWIENPSPPCMHLAKNPGVHSTIEAIQSQRNHTHSFTKKMCQTSNERRWLASTNQHLFIRFNIFSSCFSNNSTEEDQLGEVCVGPVKGLSDKRLPGWPFLGGNWSQLQRIFKVFTYSFLQPPHGIWNKRWAQHETRKKLNQKHLKQSSKNHFDMEVVSPI